MRVIECVRMRAKQTFLPLETWPVKRPPAGVTWLTGTARWIVLVCCSGRRARGTRRDLPLEACHHELQPHLAAGRKLKLP